VVLDGRARIGRRNRIFHFASIGAPPQDKKYAGEDTAVEIGDGNVIREYVTIKPRHRARRGRDPRRQRQLDHGVRAFRARLPDRQPRHLRQCLPARGPCHGRGLGDLRATTLVHQFVHVGAHAFTGMGTYLPQDLPPFVTAAGNMARPYGINSEGLKRRGFSPETINGLKQAYRTLYRRGLGLDEARRELEAQAEDCPPVREILDFLARTKRGIIR